METETRKEIQTDMKSWHLGIIVAVLIGYALGIFFPGVGQTAKAKLGL